MLQRIVAEAGYSLMDSADVYAELILLEDYAVLGGLYSIDYSNGARAPSDMRLWHFSDPQLVPVGD